MFKCFAAIAMTALLATQAHAAINIDFGSTSTPGAPANTFGAASGVTGTWNNPAIAGNSGFSLLDTSGDNSGATLSDSFDDGVFQNRGFGADIAALYHDGFVGSVPTETMTINNLSNGAYDVYVYVIGSQTNTVNGDSQSLNSSGSFTGFVEGDNYTRHSVNVTNGTLSMSFFQNGGAPAINGLQIVESTIPAPLAAPALLLMLLGVRRRR